MYKKNVTVYRNGIALHIAAIKSKLRAIYQYNLMRAKTFYSYLKNLIGDSLCSIKGLSKMSFTRLMSVFTSEHCHSLQFKGCILSNDNFIRLKEISRNILGNFTKSLKHHSIYFTNTLALNDRCLNQTALYTYKLALHSIKINWALFLDILNTNEEFMIKYLKGLELEIFYGPAMLLELIDAIKGYLRELTLDAREEKNIMIGCDETLVLRGSNYIIESDNELNQVNQVIQPEDDVGSVVIQSQDIDSDIIIVGDVGHSGNVILNDKPKMNVPVVQNASLHQEELPSIKDENHIETEVTEELIKKKKKKAKKRSKANS